MLELMIVVGVITVAMSVIGFVKELPALREVDRILREHDRECKLRKSSKT